MAAVGMGRRSVSSLRAYHRRLPALLCHSLSRQVVCSHPACRHLARAIWHHRWLGGLRAVRQPRAGGRQRQHRRGFSALIARSANYTRTRARSPHRTPVVVDTLLMHAQEPLQIHMDSARDEEILAMKRAWAAAAPLWELARPKCATERPSVTFSTISSEKRESTTSVAQTRRLRGDVRRFAYLHFKACPVFLCWTEASCSCRVAQASRQLYLANPGAWPDGLRTMQRPPANSPGRDSVQVCLPPLDHKICFV
jgi:hypothetical protein